MSKIISPLKYNTFKLAIEDEVYFGDDGVLYIGKKDRTLQVYLSNQGAITQAIQSLNGLNASSQTFANDINIVINSAGATHTLGWLGVLSTLRGGTGLSAIGSPLQVLRVNSVGTSLEYATVSGTGTVTSVSLNMPSAFTVVGSPITTAGTFTVSGAGTSSQYIDGTGALQTFPSGGTGTVTTVSTAGLISGGPITTAGTITTSMNTNKLVGRATAGVGIMEEITLGTGLSLSGTTLNATGGGGIKSGNATQVSAGVYTTTISGVTSYTAGDTYIIKFNTANDGDSTLNISSVGAVPIYKNTNVKLSSGDIKANQEITIVYDGTNFQAIGLVSTQLLAYVHNSEGAVINKGQVVYAYQATGNKMSVKLARADSDATSAKTIGMVYDSSIGVGADGYIIIQGVIEGINTAAYSAGDTLYLSGTTFGSVTNIKPYAPTHLVYVGVVERSNAGNGQIYVRCQNGYELDEIHDVDLITTPPVNNDLLTYVTGSPNLWKNRSLGSILGGTTSQYVRGDGTLATTPTGTVTGVTATAPLTSSGGATPDISTSMATNRLIGRTTVGTGVMEEIQVGNFLTLSGGVLSSVPPIELSQVYTTAWNLAPTIILSAASGGSGSSANQWYIIPKYLSPNTSISEIGVRITSFTTSLTARLAIYTSTYDSTNKGFIPDSRVANSGALTITGTGFVSFTLPSTIQVSGWVFFVVGYTATTCSFRTVNSNSVIGLPALVNSGSPLNTDTTVRNGMYTNTTNARTADPPNPWSGTLTQNNANIPAIYFFVP